MNAFEIFACIVIPVQWLTLGILQVQNARLKRLHRDLLNASIEQLREYAEFRAKFEAYRARYDPIDTTITGNVIQIERGKPE